MSTLRVLGCSGGIGDGLATTSLLLNDKILIDAGTGVGNLTLDEMSRIEYVFLTHSHLDHLCSIPFLLDTVGVNRPQPLTVYGIAPTIAALQQHIFNDVIWPDFTVIPSKENACLRFQTIGVEETLSVDGIRILSLPVRHSIAANAYWLDSGNGALVFSGDTGSSGEFWDAIHRELSKHATGYLKHLIIETSFTNGERELAALSGHYYPQALINDLEQLQVNDCQVWVTHLKPGEGLVILSELQNGFLQSPASARFKLSGLEHGQVLRF